MRCSGALHAHHSTAKRGHDHDPTLIRMPVQTWLPPAHAGLVCVCRSASNKRACARARTDTRTRSHACVHVQHRVDAKRSCNGGSPLRCAAAARHTSGLSLGAILGTGEVDEVERRDAEHIKARRGLVLTIISRFDRLLDGLSDSPIHSSQSPKRGSARGADDAPERTALAAPYSACGKKGHTECEVGMDGHSARSHT